MRRGQRPAERRFARRSSSSSGRPENAFTKNIIKLYKPDEHGPDSYVKQQCMHCLEPACVAACPFQALSKNDENGVVAWEPSRCIGCRYCEVACAYHVPKFEWNAFNPKIVKCEFCRPRLAKGYEPACTSVCPTHAVVFGFRENLLIQAKKRIEETPGKYFENRVYGEHEAGGTQVLYLSHVPFVDIGLPELGNEPVPARLKWQKRIYKFLAFPLLLYVIAGRHLEEELDRSPERNAGRRRKNRIEATTVKNIVVRWQRGVPVYGMPIITPFFVFLCTMGMLAIVLSAYREYAGLGPVSGMNDIYAWGIWKTFNTMVLTGLGSGGFSVGIAAWIFFRRRLHSVMRTALLTSLLAYFSGLIALGVDVGRPWNFYWALMPWKWNAHSPLLEVCVCMPALCVLPAVPGEHASSAGTLVLHLAAPQAGFAGLRRTSDSPNLSVCDRSGLCPPYDAPILAGRPDAARWFARAPSLADAFFAASLRLGRRVPRLCLRDRDFNGQLSGVEAAARQVGVTRTRQYHVVAGFDVGRIPVSGYPHSG